MLIYVSAHAALCGCNKFCMSARHISGYCWCEVTSPSHREVALRDIHISPMVCEIIVTLQDVQLLMSLRVNRPPVMDTYCLTPNIINLSYFSLPTTTTTHTISWVTRDHPNSCLLILVEECVPEGTQLSKLGPLG